MDPMTRLSTIGSTMDEGKTIDVTNYGSLGLSLQETLDEMQQDESLPYLPDQTVQSILGALETAVDTTATEFVDDSDHSTATITANVRHYNRFGDKWCIALDNTTLQTKSSKQPGEATRASKKRMKSSEPLQLNRLQLLAYKEALKHK